MGLDSDVWSLMRCLVCLRCPRVIPRGDSIGVQLAWEAVQGMLEIESYKGGQASEQCLRLVWQALVMGFQPVAPL